MSESAAWYLEYFAAGGRLRKIAVGVLPFRVGRLPGLELVLGLDSVSKTHAELFQKDGALWIRDLASRNGTFVNHERVQEAALEEGDIVHFAESEFRLARRRPGEQLPRSDNSLFLRAPFAGESRAERRRVGNPHPLVLNLHGYQIAQPRSHENLAVYVVTQDDGVDVGTRFCTLRDALARRTGVVHETGTVRRIIAENLEADRSLYIQSGEIVKGGRQDRAVRFDTVVPPLSTVEMEAYCVERRRWHRRGAESEATFSGSDTAVPTAAMKSAVFRGIGQNNVWATVDDTQDRLTRTTGVSVRSSESPSSYQLSSESESVREAISGYQAALGTLGDAPGAVGAVAAINGVLNRADIYVTAGLFQDLWPKLLEGAAVEAVLKRSEYNRQATNLPTIDEVRSYLEESRHGAGSQWDVTADVVVTAVASGRTTFYETRTLKPSETWVHLGYVTTS